MNMKAILLLILVFITGCETEIHKKLDEKKAELALCNAKIDKAYSDAQAQLEVFERRYQNHAFEQEEQLIQQANLIALLRFGLQERETAMAHKIYCDWFGPVAILCDKEKLEKARALGEHAFDPLELAQLIFLTVAILIVVPLLIFLALAWYYWRIRIENFNQEYDQLQEARAKLVEREGYLVEHASIAENKAKRAEQALFALKNEISEHEVLLSSLGKQIHDKKKRFLKLEKEFAQAEKLKSEIDAKLNLI